jgi:hypothetical protein
MEYAPRTSNRPRPPAHRRRAVALIVASSAAVAAVAVHAQQGGGVGPDLVVYGFTDIDSYGAEDGFAAYALGTDTCNRGDQPVEWCDQDFDCGAGATPADHPVVAQNLYRLKDGRFEQIGMSWIKHGFSSANSSDPGCAGAQGQSCAQPPAGQNQLGIGCTDPYAAFFNGDRPLGPRSEADAASGEFPFPPTSPGPPYTVYDQRIKVAIADLDPASNPGAVYFVEGHYVAPDDAQAGNGLNNASHGRATVGGAPGYVLALAGGFVERQPAIFGWQAEDPEVELAVVDIPGSSPVERFHVARRVTALGGGDWHYEYAVHNLNSDRSVNRFTVDFPPGATITDPGFHDVEYHSGEPYDAADWAVDLSVPGVVTWSTDDFSTDPDANALRWSTTYSFRFDADVPPGPEPHVLGLFKPGSPAEVTFNLAGAIFVDGFESGDTTAWTSSTP